MALVVAGIRGGSDAAATLTDNDVALVRHTQGDPIHIAKSEYEHWLEVSRRTITKPASATQRNKPVMQLLITSVWIDQQAKLMGINVTQDAIDKKFEQTKRSAFPTEKGYKDFLKKSGETEEDLKARTKTDLQSQAIRNKVQDGVSAQGDRAAVAKARSDALSSFTKGFRASWKGSTTCASAYTMDLCGSTR